MSKDVFKKLKGGLNGRYSGMSLVESLITVTIIGVVMLLVSVTLTTLIKASSISSGRTTAREESEFILELIRRTTRSSHSDDIRIYSVEGRSFNVDTGLTVDDETSGYEASVGEGVVGTEIHFRPTGFDRWVCLGYFPDVVDSETGYILMASAQTLGSAADCFDGSTQNFLQSMVYLNSPSLAVNLFEIQFFSTQGNNVLMTIDIEVEPKNWSEGFTGLITPKYFKQAVVSTQKLDWE